MSDQLGKYRIDGILGKGAMGVVYKAFDPYIQRVVALKTVRKELFGEGQIEDLISRFKNEAQAAGRLNHPNIVMVYDYGEDNELAYIAMEFVDGVPLNAMIQPGQQIERHRIKAWMSDLLLALQYAHSRGVVHRDIKPSNLMITSGDRLKVSDFGIAHIDTSTLTQTGSVIGTPSYMSPEQFRGEPSDARSDLFSAGIVLYQLLCGARPFSGSTSAVMHQILNVTPPPPSHQLPSLGNGYDEVVGRAMAKERAERFGSAREFLESLEAVDDTADPAADSSRTVPNDRISPAAGASDPGMAADSDPAIPGDSDRTILADSDSTILVAHPWNTVRTQHRFVETGMDTGSGGILASWKSDVLPEIEKLLSYQIGPIGKLLAKKSLAKAESLEELCTLLLPHIPAQPARVQFQQAIDLLTKRLAATCTGGSGGLSHPMASGSRDPYIHVATDPALASSPPPAPAPQTVDDAWEYAVTQQLLVLVGPIARILVKRAGRQTRIRTEFLQLLAEHVESDSDRARFLAEASALSSR